MVQTISAELAIEHLVHTTAEVFTANERAFDALSQ